MVIDFLWHLRGSRSLERAPEDDRVMAAIERLVDRQRKTITRRTPDSLAFNDPLWSQFFVVRSNWRAMVIYDRGRFWIERGPRGRRLQYDLRSLHGFIFCTVAAGIFFTFAVVSDLGLASAARMAALAFGWLYGVNLLIAIPRVWLAISSAVRQARRGG
jgi:hypothetical protein